MPFRSHGSALSGVKLLQNYVLSSIWSLVGNRKTPAQSIWQNVVNAHCHANSNHNLKIYIEYIISDSFFFFTCISFKQPTNGMVLRWKAMTYNYHKQVCIHIYTVTCFAKHSSEHKEIKPIEHYRKLLACLIQPWASVIFISPSKIRKSSVLQIPLRWL